MATGLAASVEDARMRGIKVRFVASRKAKLIDVKFGRHVVLVVNRWHGLSGDQLAALIDAQVMILQRSDRFYFEQQQSFLPVWPQYAMA